MEVLTKAKAIRKYCLDCCYGQAAEVRRCPCSKCALYPYRFGSLAKAARIDGVEYKTPKKQARVTQNETEDDENDI